MCNYKLATFIFIVKYFQSKYRINSSFSCKYVKTSFYDLCKRLERRVISWCYFPHFERWVITYNRVILSLVIIRDVPLISRLKYLQLTPLRQSLHSPPFCSRMDFQVSVFLFAMFFLVKCENNTVSESNTIVTTTEMSTTKPASFLCTVCTCTGSSC